DERARAVLDQLLALLWCREPRIAHRAAWMKILRLPGERRRAVRGEPAIFLFHRNARRRKVGDLVLVYVLGIARQHDRGFDRAAVNAVTNFLLRKQALRHAEARPGGGDNKEPMERAQVLRHQAHGGAVAAVTGDDHELPKARARDAFANLHPAPERDLG